MLEFKCPSCGHNRIECCLNGPHAATITEIDEEGDFEYAPYESSSNPDRFQCENCGYVLETDEEDEVKAYTITEHYEVVEWIEKHCSQK